MDKVFSFVKATVTIMLAFFLVACVAANEKEGIKTVPENQVSILKFKFIPQTLTIKAGESVTWINNEKRQYHSVWFEENGDPESDYLFPAETYNKQFTKKGTYKYKCGPHPEMIGVIIVE